MPIVKEKFEKENTAKNSNIKLFATSKRFFFTILLINTILIMIGILMGNPEEIFGKEASYITWVSFAQLFSISIISFKIFKERTLSITKKEAMIWALIAFGFLFLSIDEVARIHENMDSFFHKKIIHMKETAITDRLDDIIIGIYALIGAGVLFKFKKELGSFKEALPYLITCFLLIFLMMVTEVIANRFDLLPFLINDKTLAHNIYDLFKIGEETLKLYAEAVMVSGFYLCLQISKGLTKKN